MRDRSEREGRSSKRGRSFQYRSNDADSARKASVAGGDFDSIFDSKVKSFRPGEGKHRIRILPRTWADEDGPRHWGYEIFVHFNVGPDNSAYLCLSKMKGEDCPICNERTELSRTAKTEEEEEAAK